MRQISAWIDPIAHDLFLSTTTQTTQVSHFRLRHRPSTIRLTSTRALYVHDTSIPLVIFADSFPACITTTTSYLVSTAAIMSPSTSSQSVGDVVTTASHDNHSNTRSSWRASITSFKDDFMGKEGREWKRSPWRHTLGIALLLVTVVLWTTSNFLASVSPFPFLTCDEGCIHRRGKGGKVSSLSRSGGVCVR